ncbi:MAG TPA: COX15/CtaA family protein [Vicinamibacterales bacterium]|nr:COX15/CtaA family protein [Vicinamibacterales bacterium]
MIDSTAAVASGSATTGADWRLEIPDSRRRPLRIWLWSVAAMTLAVLIVGGITRLTHSGLSIVNWDPIMGVVPPLTEAQWQQAFDEYRAYPEYQKLRRGMSLAEFKFIFFWEYMHRLLARAIGVVFLIPFVFFAARRYLTRPLAWRALALFALGGMQGLLGWLMVASGLVDRPSVSHYRLAAHLSLAFLIFGGAVWLARELRAGDTVGSAPARTRRMLLRGLTIVGLLFALQVVWGAFVAGLKAGFLFNTFPLMAGRLVPPGLLMLDPALANFVENAVTVQWTHRMLGTVLALAVLAFWWRVRRSDADRHSRRLNTAFLSLMLCQYALGVVTLLMVVPVALGVAHQALAMVLFGLWVVWLHHARALRPA